MDPRAQQTDEVLELARQCGFAAAGVAPGLCPENPERLTAWLDAGCGADLDYLDRHLPLRLNLETLLPDVRSVLTLACSYAPGPEDPTPDDAFVSAYARGRDYHKVLKKRAHRLCDRLAERFEGFSGRAFVDSGPTGERALAIAAGLGWVGRNGMLVVPGLGNQVVLAVVLTNLSLRPGVPVKSKCGDCRRCLDACPTGALRGDGMVDVRLCRSYHSIENRGLVPDYVAQRWGHCVFGCDACVVACPHSAGPAGDAELRASADMHWPSLEQIRNWTEADWDAFTRGSARRRATFAMYRRNAELASRAVLD